MDPAQPPPEPSTPPDPSEGAAPSGPSSPSLPHGRPDLPTLPALPGDPCLRNRCSACCHGTEMMLTDADLERLQALRPGEAFWYEEGGDRMLRTVGVSDGGDADAGSDDGDTPGDSDARGESSASDAPCWFLGDDGRCTVHAARPEGCRVYPAIWDVDRERVVLDGEHCPHTGEFQVPRRIEDAVRRLARRLERERDRRMAER